MSNIYIQEPPTAGKVLLITTVGDIDVELWSKEAPKACRNFVQLCMEGYYNGTIFHRVVKEFIVQGGDPTGTGEGGESIYGEPFKDEIHSRLRFNRRGLVALANSGKDDNGSQFFFTLAATPELQGKHTIFGKVAGDTIYNMLKFGESETDQDDRPLHCHKIIKTEILNNPFDDIVPRVQQEKRVKKSSKKQKEKGVKNFKLLSFGEEAEEDEEQTVEINKELTKKNKSAHDALNDPKLSVEPAVESTGQNRRSPTPEEPETEEIEEKTEEYDIFKRREEDLLSRRAEIQKEIQQLKDDYRNRNKKDKPATKEPEEKVKETEKAPVKNNELKEEYEANLAKYGEQKSKVPLSGSSRQDFTMKLLSKFKDKLKAVKETVPEDAVTSDDVNDDGEAWMGHALKFEQTTTLARDANTKGDDWFDITDPRNPITKRRREASEQKMRNQVKRPR